MVLKSIMQSSILAAVDSESFEKRENVLGGSFIRFHHCLEICLNLNRLKCCTFHVSRLECHFLKKIEGEDSVI